MKMVLFQMLIKIIHKYGFLDLKKKYKRKLYIRTKCDNIISLNYNNVESI